MVRGFRTGAVELDASLVFTVAAPVLLRVRPSLHPIGKSCMTVIDFAMCMTNSMHHVRMKVVASMPSARASPILMTAAPAFLVVRPAEIPIGETCKAVVVELGTWRR